MNRIYQVIWSSVKNCYVVVSENASRHGKKKAAHLAPSTTKRTMLAMSLGAAVLLSACASNGQKPEPGPDPSSFFASVGKTPVRSTQADPRFANSNTPSPAVTRRVPQRVGTFRVRLDAVGCGGSGCAFKICMAGANFWGSWRRVMEES